MHKKAIEFISFVEKFDQFLAVLFATQRWLDVK